MSPPTGLFCCRSVWPCDARLVPRTGARDAAREEMNTQGGGQAGGPRRRQKEAGRHVGLARVRLFTLHELRVTGPARPSKHGFLAE